MRKLRIALYTDHYLPVVDGVVNQIINIRKELESRGHDVYVLAAGDENTLEIARTDPKLIVFRGIRFADKKSTFALDPIAFLRQFLDLPKFDIVHTHSPFIMGISAAIVAKITGAKLVSTFHTLFFHEMAMSKYVSYFSKSLSLSRKFIGWSQKAMMGYLAWYYRKCSYVIAPTAFIKNMLLRKRVASAEVVNNGLDFGADSFAVSKREARKLLGIGQRERIVLFIGRISREKNLQILIRAGKLMEKHRINVIIAGNGPDMQQCAQLSTELRTKNVRFAGFVEEKEKRYYYAAADVFCNPSDFEVQSTVDIEAMAMGTPILVPKNSSQEEFLCGGSGGESFDINDPSDLCSKAVRIIKKQKNYSPKSIASRFTIKNTVDNLLKIYARSLSERAVGVRKSYLNFSSK